MALPIKTFIYDFSHDFPIVYRTCGVENDQGRHAVPRHAGFAHLEACRLSAERMLRSRDAFGREFTRLSLRQFSNFHGVLLGLIGIIMGHQWQ